MSIDTVLVPNFPHGTPTGYDRGCRGALCPNNKSDQLMSCEQAIVRYRGDLTYRRAVQAGTATADVEQFAKPTRTVVEDPQPRRLFRYPDGIAHGTSAGYDKHGCRLGNQCPAKLEGNLSCLEMSNKKKRDRRANGSGSKTTRTHRNVNSPDFPHGTASGFHNHKCRLGDNCPGVERTGMTCRDAYNKQRRDTHVEREAARVIDPKKVPHGTVTGYRYWRCRLGDNCPGVERTGITCQQANNSYKKTDAA